MAAENAEYERVLGELNAVCEGILDLCGEMNLDKIKKDLQVVSQKSKEKMETLKRLKFEIESLRVMNTSLEAENTILKLNVERIGIDKDGKGGEGEGGEGEGGEDAEEESGEGELGEGGDVAFEDPDEESGEGELGEGGDVAFEDPDEESGEGENHAAVLQVPAYSEEQIGNVLKYIEENVFLDSVHDVNQPAAQLVKVDNQENVAVVSIEPKFQSFFNSRGTILTASTLKKLINRVLTEALDDLESHKFTPVESSKFRYKMGTHPVWINKDDGNYKERTLKFLQNKNLF